MTEREVFSVITEVIEYCLMSSTIGGLVAEDGYKTRGTMNVLLISGFGSGKSAMMRGIEKTGAGIRLTDYSMPGVVGTIKSSGRVVKGFVTLARGSTLLIDEFQKFDKRTKDALLSLMEDHFYRRTLGYNVDPPIEEFDEFYRVFANENYLETYSRLSYMIGCMYFRRKTSDDYALLSRTFPIVLTMTEEDAFDLFLGKTPFKITKNITKYREKLAHREIFVSKNIRVRLLELIKEAKIGLKVEAGFLTRALWDLTRISAIESCLKGYDEVTEDSLYTAVKYAPLLFMGYTRGQLTVKQMEIYSCICNSDSGINPKKITQITNLPEVTVLKSLKELSKLKLIDSVQVGKNKIYYAKGSLLMG